MLKKIAIIILLVGILIASPHVYNHVQFNNGKTLKITACHGVKPTESGGFVMHYAVIDKDGNTSDIYTGKVVQWDKTEGDFLRIGE